MCTIQTNYFRSLFHRYLVTRRLTHQKWLQQDYPQLVFLLNRHNKSEIVYCELARIGHMLEKIDLEFVNGESASDLETEVDKLEEVHNCDFTVTSHTSTRLFYYCNLTLKTLQLSQQCGHQQLKRSLQHYSMIC